MSSVEESFLVKRTSNRDLEHLRRGLTAWFSQVLGPNSEPSLSSLESPGKTGMSAETLLFDLTWQENGRERSGRFVARLPPSTDTFPIFPRYDFDLQVGVMRLVGSKSSVPVPKIPWQERGSDALGAPFFIMERIEGEMVTDNPPYVFGGWLAEAPVSRQHQVQQELIDVLAGIHGISASEEETAFLHIEQPGDTCVRRHFAWNKTLYEWGRNGMHFPLLEQLFDWLEAHWPENEGPAVISWGDARPANVLWRDFKAVAVLDWEMAMMGPREMDVGYMIFFHKYFQHIAKVMAGMDVMPGFLRRDEVVAAYEAKTGTCLHDVDWYIAYGLLHQAVTEIRLSQRRILFGEMERPADTNEYLYSRGLIQLVLEGQPGLWS